MEKTGLIFEGVGTFKEIVEIKEISNKLEEKSIFHMDFSRNLQMFVEISKAFFFLVHKNRKFASK